MAADSGRRSARIAWSRSITVLGPRVVGRRLPRRRPRSARAGTSYSIRLVSCGCSFVERLGEVVADHPVERQPVVVLRAELAEAGRPAPFGSAHSKRVHGTGRITHGLAGRARCRTPHVDGAGACDLDARAEALRLREVDERGGEPAAVALEQHVLRSCSTKSRWTTLRATSSWPRQPDQHANAFVGSPMTSAGRG